MRTPILAVAIFLVALVVALLAAACGGGGDNVAPTQTPEPVPTFAGDLRLEQAGGLTLDSFLGREFASDRTEFSLCVDSAGAIEIGPAELALVDQALGDALADLPEVPRRVTQRCPAPAALIGAGLNLSELGSDKVPARFVAAPEVPSLHQLWVYFVSPDLYNASFEFPYPYAITAEEYVCQQDVCRGVTNGLYVTPTVTRNLLQQAILDYLGLAPEWVDVCNATPEISWCAEFWRESGLTATP